MDDFYYRKLKVYTEIARMLIGLRKNLEAKHSSHLSLLTSHL